MNLYTFYSDTHLRLYEDYFIKSLINTDFDKVNLIVTKVEQQSKSGAFMEAGWLVTMRDKMDLLCEAIDENWGSWFIFADCDIQFLKPFYDDLCLHKNDQYDLIAQSDTGTICAGFFLAKADTKLKKLFNKVRKNITNDFNDQVALNAYSDMIEWRLLDSSKYFTIGNFNGGKVWNGETDIIIPENILVHHANFTVGVENKILLMEYVKNSRGIYANK